MLKYVMKNILLFLVLLFVPAVAYAQPEIQFIAETYNMGDVSDETATHYFEFKNIGTSTLIIEKLITS